MRLTGEGRWPPPAAWVSRPVRCGLFVGAGERGRQGGDRATPPKRITLLARRAAYGRGASHAEGSGVTSRPSSGGHLHSTKLPGSVPGRQSSAHSDRPGAPGCGVPRLGSRPGLILNVGHSVPASTQIITKAESTCSGRVPDLGEKEPSVTASLLNQTKRPRCSAELSCCSELV